MGRRIIKRGIGILLQIYRLGVDNKWRSVGFSRNHVRSEGGFNSWEWGKKVLLIINGLCVWSMFFVIYISSCIQYYYYSHVKVINYLHRNRREAPILYFSHNPKMGSR